MSEVDGAALTLYSRAGCHLCEDAEAALDALNQPFTRTDIGTDPDLEARYGWDVPVLLRGEVVLAKGVINVARLRRVLGLTGPG
ncbi:glutaredoxin family protein [Deinococcus sp.]|uniref:glutaredoxin family protein n=1 Tax=Deinococcus sp. TaxID=47478 RepID=UPI0025ED9399|nr:glutaredoxin family protein [Deinococcus sp.]